MNAKRKNALVGLFVLGALALAVAAVAVFGSGMFFTQKYRFVLFFENSVSGLDLGAPVLFRGVPIGVVTEINIDANASDLHFYIPVTIELQGGKIRMSANKKGDMVETLVQARHEGPVKLLRDLVERGLRAQLVTQSFVTGQLAVSLDFKPDTPVRLVGGADIPEIPTIPSTFEMLSQTLKQLPLRELVERLTAAISGIERLVNSPQTAETPLRLNAVLTEGATFLSDLRARIDPLSKNLESAVKNYDDLARNLDRQAQTLGVSANKTLEALDVALREAGGALAKIDKLAAPNSPVVTDLRRALDEVAAAARSIRGLADYLERHPEALIQGKGPYRR